MDQRTDGVAQHRGSAAWPEDASFAQDFNSRHPFPVVSETPNRVVAGFNDKHLDFRLVVDVAGEGVARNVTATTLVLTHNLLGRVYLAIIMPFHRIIVPAMLRQVAG